MSNRITAAELVARFVTDLETQPQASWWERFYQAVPGAGDLAGQAAALMGERTLQELTDEELTKLTELTERINDLATRYAAERGEEVPPR